MTVEDVCGNGCVIWTICCIAEEKEGRAIGAAIMEPMRLPASASNEKGIRNLRDALSHTQ
jgi:hypothetical protein